MKHQQNEEEKFEAAEFYWIHMSLSDAAWLEALSDIEEMGANLATMKFNLKFRVHLTREKRIMGLDHLTQVN